MNGLRGVLAPLRAGRAFLGPLALVLFATYGYFVCRPAWNQNSRLALTRAVVEHGTMTIDPYHDTTGDKSFRDGHFYSDKAPGTSLLAVPAYATFYGLKRLTGGQLPAVSVRTLDPFDARAGRAPDPGELKAGDRLTYNRAYRAALYLGSLTTTGLCTVLAVGMMYLLGLRQLSGRRRGAVLVALTYGLATLAFPYGTVLYGHGLSASFLAIGFGLVTLAPRGSETRPVGLLAGASLGMAVLCEYPAAVPALLVAMLALRLRGPAFFATVVAGGVPLAGVLAAYHTVAFGHPLKTGYDFVYLEEFAEGMKDAYGLGPPNASAARELLFGSYRGLFYLCPVLLLAVWGLLRGVAETGAARDRGAGPAAEPGLPRPSLIVAVIISVYYVGLNAGYYMWDGGASFGPRHLVPALPFLALGLAPAIRTVPRAHAVLGAMSLVHMLAGATASPEAPRHGDPIWSYAIPRIVAGDLDSASNLGLLLGLPGLWSLLPLAALWIWVWPLVPGPREPEPDSPRG